MQYYNQGLSDVAASKMLNCSKRTFGNWRERNSLPPNVLSSAYKNTLWAKEDLIRLNKQGLTDLKIGKELGISEKTVNFYRNLLKLPSNQSHNIKITKEMEEVLVGTLLGDGYINCTSKSKKKVNKDTAILIFAHSLKQKDYCFHKYEILKSLYNREPFYNLQQRNDKINESYYAITKSSISLKKYRDVFYRGKEKIIPENIGDYFTKKSLAYLYMDDGSRKKNEYTICLNSFSEESLDNLQNLLLSWNIETSVFKNHVLYIKAKSRDNFIKAIQSYIIPSMDYKCPFKIP